MSKTKGKIIEELVSLILMQEKQIKRLKEKIRQAKKTHRSLRRIHKRGR